MIQKQYIIAGLIPLAILGAVLFISNKSGQLESAANEQQEHDDDAVQPYEIYPSDVVKKIENGEPVILLDVRTPEEYEEVHLKNALLLPVQELSQGTLAKIGLGEDAKDTEIIIYCRSGARSKTAYDIMKSLGYTNIKSVAGGMIHWEEDNYPLTETGAYKGGATNTQPEKITTGGPRIAFDRAFHDFGIIPQYGGATTTTFTVQNTGTEVLTIGTPTTSCSCASASISTASILPGKSAELTVRFDPNFHAEPEGVFKRTVFIPTNDRAMPEAEVVIQVDIDEGK